MFVHHSEDIKEQNEHRRKKIASVLEMKKQQTNETKKLLEEQKAYRESYLAKLAEMNQNRFKNIKRQRIEGKQKINSFLSQRKNFFKMENEKEMQEQEKIKKAKVDEIQKLEKIEMTLIEKLQNTQKNQAHAYEKLESAISLPPQEFKKKYEDDFNQSPMKKTENNIEKNATTTKKEAKETTVENSPIQETKE